MDLYKIIGTLYDEKRRLDQLIDSLETLERTGGTLDPQKLTRRRGRKSMSAEERRRVSERMKHYWALRREQDGATGPG